MEISLVTGANGFMGQALCQHLRKKGIQVRGSVRTLEYFKAGEDISVVGHLSAQTDWTQALAGVNTIYHLAGTVHQPEITDSTIYRETIADASLHLAQQAYAAGVQRLVYVSSAHVYSNSQLPMTEESVKNPLTVYGKAKLAAEEALMQFAQQSNWDIVIVRPPLVYGNGVKANFKNLVNLIKKSMVLPLGCASAKRSFVGIHNLQSFLHLCGTDAKARNQIFNITDDEDVSVAELCQIIKEIVKKKSYLLAVPNAWMKMVLKIVGKTDVYEKLFEASQLDINHAKKTLNWKPILTVRDELENVLRD